MIRVYFQPTVQVDLAMSQVTAIVQTVLRVLPPGITPPAIIKYDASSVPIVQLSLSGQGLDGVGFVRSGAELYSARGCRMCRALRFPCRMGARFGKSWSIRTRIFCIAKHLSASDISTTINSAEPDSACGYSAAWETRSLSSS